MAEEGVTGGGGAQSVNIGVKVENNSAVEEIKKLSKEVEALKGKLHGVADASGKANAGVTGMGQQKGSIDGLGGSFRALGEQMGSALSVGAALSGALQLIKADMANLAATAKDASGQRQAYASASGGFPVIAAGLRQALQGTPFGGAEGAALAEGALKSFPVEMLQNGKAVEALKASLQAGPAFGVGPNGLPTGAAELAKLAGYVSTKMPELAGANSVKFSALLERQGLRNPDAAREPLNKLIGAGMDPETALLLGAYAQNQQGGNEALGGLASMFEKTDPASLAAAKRAISGVRGPLTPEQGLSIMNTEQRFNYISKHPEAFGARGALWAGFQSTPMKGVESLDSGWREITGEIASTPDASTAKAEMQVRAESEKLKATGARDSSLYSIIKAKIAQKYDEEHSPIQGLLAQTDYYLKYLSTGDPVLAAMQAEPELGGLTPEQGLLPPDKLRSGRGAYLSKIGLAGASGEAQPTQRVEVVATVRTDKGNRVAVQSQPSVGGGS